MLLAAEAAVHPKFSIGLLTDLHYGDKPEHINRYCRETLGKLREAVDVFNAERPALVVELGDLIDQADSVEQEIGWLKQIEQVFAATVAPRHYVFGNHCVGTLTKSEFQAHTGAAKTPHYAFTHEGITFIILDACFRSDGEPYQRKNFDWTDANIPASQLAWLRDELARAKGSVVVLAHQRLDEAGKHSVRNAAAVRAELAGSGKVLAVFQGHSHKNDYQQIAGIHYCTLVAMVEGSGPENSGYAFLDVMPDHSLRVRGYRQQADRAFGASRKP
jgi:alkaline phosphatase